MELKDKLVTILGLARSGQAAARVLHARGAEVLVSDTRPASELHEAIASLPAGVQVETGGHSSRCLDADLIVISPGIPRDLAILQAAQADGVEILGEIELAYRLAQVPIVGITGTNGKTTTTTLVGKILEESGKRIGVGGNIGQPLVGFVDDPDLDVLVAEISSFQLESTSTFRPTVAAWLNFSDDHLNRHGSREAYWEAKKQLFVHQSPTDWAILNADDAAVQPLAGALPARHMAFAIRSELREGVLARDGWITHRVGGEDHPIMPISEIQLRGEHNLENCLAATAIALALGVTTDAIRRAISAFGGVEHRIEPVRVLDGVQWFNDSKGTNYDSTIKALRSFHEPLVLIAGGRDKGGAIAPLVATIRECVQHVVLVGESAPTFERFLRAGGYEAITMTSNLEEAIAQARQEAVTGGVVLYSPAATSFDMFRDYEHRGRTFKTLVNALEASLP